MNYVTDDLDFKVKSLVDITNPIEKVYWNKWEDFVTEFDIEIYKKTMKAKVYQKTSWTIFEAYQLDRDSSEPFAEIMYDAKDGKLIFTQNTHNGMKTIEIDEFELNKKIHVRVTPSIIKFGYKQKNIINPGDEEYWAIENELKSRKTQIRINNQNDKIFKVTDFSIKHE